MSQDLHQRLQALQEEIGKRVRRQQFDTWFRPLKIKQADQSAIILEVPNIFHKEHLERNYLSILGDAARTSFGFSAPLDFVISNQSALEQAAASTDKEEVTARRRPFNNDYVFGNFIVGPNNRLAHAASIAVAESPGTAYNPLFIYGSVGLGKTHLLQAICHAILKKNPRANITYQSCDTFVNNFISAVQSSKLAPFRRKYRNPDVLVIDDIHFLANKEHTQEEFFHTFNSLYNDTKQIVLSSDSEPQEIPTLEERLVSRFKWGLVGKLDRPSYETRVAIIKSKARLRYYELPEDVVHFVAENVTSNVREIEGAIVRLVGYASLAGRNLTLDFAREILKDSTARTEIIRVEDIIRVAADLYAVKVADLQSKKRTKSIAFPRQVCMFLARELTDLPLVEIGGYFGGRDHTTVIHAVEKIKKLSASDGQLRDRLERIKEGLLKAE